MASAGESAQGAIEREVGKLLNVVRWGLSRHVMENVTSARCAAGAGNGLETGGGVQRRKHEPRTRGMHSAFCGCPGGAGTRRHRCLHLCGTAPASGRCAGRRRHATTPWTRQERACGFTFSWTALSVQTGGWRMEHRAADWNLSRATGEAAAHRKAACRSAA